MLHNKKLKLKKSTVANLAALTKDEALKVKGGTLSGLIRTCYPQCPPPDHGTNTALTFCCD